LISEVLIFVHQIAEIAKLLLLDVVLAEVAQFLASVADFRASE
jgi:hypothetical protein